MSPIFLNKMKELYTPQFQSRKQLVVLKKVEMD